MTNCIIAFFKNSFNEKRENSGVFTTSLRLRRERSVCAPPKSFFSSISFLPNITLFKYMNGIFIRPTSHLIAVCPIINGKIGITPKNAIGIKIKLSNNSAGIELKAFLVQRCFPFVKYFFKPRIYISVEVFRNHKSNPTCESYSRHKVKNLFPCCLNCPKWSGWKFYAEPEEKDHCDLGKQKQLKSFLGFFSAKLFIYNIS